MSNFPNQIDNDFTLPPVNNNITEIGSEAINALREAVISIEEEIGSSTVSGQGAKGSLSSIAERLNVSLNPDGTIKSSVLLTFNIFPIYDANVATNAAIKESKIDLFCNTETLYNNYLSVSSTADTASNWIYSIGNRLQNHIFQTNDQSGAYSHFLNQIEVSDGTINPIDERFVNRFVTTNPIDPASNGGYGRNNSNLFNLLKDINSDYIIHQKSDGYKLNSTVYPVRTLSGSYYPSNFAHTAAGLFLNTSNYTVFPTTINNLQDFADYIDKNNDILAGKRVYDLFSSGISRTSRSSSLLMDGYGPAVLPTNKIKSFILQGNSSVPQDNPTNGDDIIQFIPPENTDELKIFNNNFSLIKIGDAIRVNYGLIPNFGVLETEFLVKEKKYLPSVGNGNPTYIIRIDGKNIISTEDGYARVDRPLFNVNKGGVLAVAAAQCLDDGDVNSLTNIIPSLIVSHPRGAVAIGNDFDPSQINETNYLLYLTLYPDGDISKPLEMTGVDITGNRGVTPGKYTLESIVNSTNNAFRKKGFNYRFLAFSYNGNFGIMLAESYNNASFSIVAGELLSGKYAIDFGFNNQNFSHPRNIIQYDSNGLVVSDPLGFGKGKSNVASPFYYQNSFTKEDAFNYPKKIFTPLRRNNYYIDGAGLESDKMSRDVYQNIDSNGDGYWEAELVTYDSNNGTFRYKINRDLSSGGLARGKTIVVQSLGSGSYVNFGRYIISNVEFNICSTLDNDNQTFITVFNGMHNTGIANASPSSLPSNSLQIGQKCAIYFSNDSVSFNLQHASDNNTYTSFKRHFEIYLDKNGKTFSLERARMNVSSSQITIDGDVKLNSNLTLSKINIVRVSPKLRGYTYNLSNIVYLILDNYTENGTFNASLRSYYHPSTSAVPDQYKGKFVAGKKGEVVRVYDQSNIDYIDFIINDNEEIDPFSSEKRIAIQLFPTLSSDQELMLLASAQLDGSTNKISNILDLREFGNVSEKDISTSLLNYISVPEKLLHANGVIRGMDATLSETSGNSFLISGGVALVNGKISQLNDRVLKVPLIQELYNGTSYPITLCLCINNNSEYEFVAILDYNSSLGNVNGNRDLKAYSYVQAQGTGSPYWIRSFYFKDLINMDDLTPVYLTNLAVNSGNVQISSLEDVRKFINNEPVNNTFTWSDKFGKSISYFKTFSAVKNWINFYGSESNLIKIRGAVRLDSLDGSNNFSKFNKPVIFEGDGTSAGFNIWDSNFIIGSSSTFKNLNISFIYNGNFSITQASPASKCIFENINFYQGQNYYSDNNQLTINLNNNNIFKNCNFNLSIRNLSINNYNYFENCVFEKMQSSSGADNIINIGNYNNFITCNFEKLKSTIDNYFIKHTSGSSTGNYNIIDGCSFASDDVNETFYEGIELYNHNTIKNCSFTTDFIFKKKFIWLNNYNTLDNINFKNIIANSLVEQDDQDVNAIRAWSGNIFNNLKFNTIQVLNGASSAICFLDANNTISNCSIKEIITQPGSNKSCIYFASYCTFINNKIYNLISRSGIFINNNYTRFSINIDGNYLNYLYYNDPNEVSIGKILDTAGGIYCNTTIRNVNITNNVFNSSLGESPTITAVQYGSKAPPSICISTNSIEDAYQVENLNIDNCKFLQSSGNVDDNLQHACIAVIARKDTSLINVNIKGNSARRYNGLIIASNSGIVISATNVNISNNKLYYISAYSTEYGNILIDGNTCSFIKTLNIYGSQNIYGSDLVNLTSGKLTISNNSISAMDIYSHGPINIIGNDMYYTNDDFLSSALIIKGVKYNANISANKISGKYAGLAISSEGSESYSIIDGNLIDLTNCNLGISCVDNERANITNNIIIGPAVGIYSNANDSNIVGNTIQKIKYSGIKITNGIVSSNIISRENTQEINSFIEKI